MRIEAKSTSGNLASASNPQVREPNDTYPLGYALRGFPTDRPSGSAGTAAADSEAEVTPRGCRHAVTRDRVDRETEPAMLDYMRHAQKKSGRHPMDLAREFFRLNRGRGKLPWLEYIQYGVYDKTRYSPEDQSRFLANTLHWPITRVCCDMTWQATTEDKWLCSHILARSASNGGGRP